MRHLLGQLRQVGFGDSGKVLSGGSVVPLDIYDG